MAVNRTSTARPVSLSQSVDCSDSLNGCPLHLLFDVPRAVGSRAFCCWQTPFSSAKATSLAGCYAVFFLAPALRFVLTFMGFSFLFLLV
jgi:hypothetical protein